MCYPSCKNGYADIDLTDQSDIVKQTFISFDLIFPIWFRPANQQRSMQASIALAFRVGLFYAFHLHPDSVEERNR